MALNAVAGALIEVFIETILTMLDKGHFRFDVFDVDVQRWELWKSGSKIKLQDKPFQLLVLLLERAGRTASHDELGREMWPENVDSNFEASLKTAVSKLRQVLGDSASRPIFIKTVHLRGYRFVAPVVNLGEGYVSLEHRNVRRPAMATSSGDAGANAGRESRLSWVRRLLGVFVAVAIIVAVVNAFRPNPSRSPSCQQAITAVIPRTIIASRFVTPRISFITVVIIRK